MALPVDFSRHVKSSADIVRIIGEHVRLKKAGANFVGLCPFHQEKTPSFSVHAARQFYYCFGCGNKGDVFHFVMEFEKLPFPEAVRRVAQRSGIPIPSDAPAGESASPERKFRAALEEIHQKALGFYRDQLQSPEAAAVRELIQKRGVTAESEEVFGLGFAPASGRGLSEFLAKQGYGPEVLEGCGLLILREQGGFRDRFRNRWIFPITSDSGKVVAFAGRALGDEQPKYLNSPETALYSKSRVLYNLSRARDVIRQAGNAVIVEGYMDAIAVWQAGVKNVVASCGTSLTEGQVRILARFGSEVVVSYDPDSAGVAATDRSLALLLEEGMSVSILRLSGGSDPDRFIQERGAAAYQSELKAAQPLFRYLAGRALELHGKTNAEAKLAGINFVLPYLAKVPNKLIRAELVADIAQKMDVNAGIILDSFQKAGVSRREFLSTPTEIHRVPAAEAMLVRVLLDNEKACRELGPLLGERAIAQEFQLNVIVNTLVGMIHSGLVPDMASLTDRLDETQQRALAQIVFDKDARPVSIDEISTYVESLERRRLERVLLSLQRQIIEAEKMGETIKAIELARKKADLDKEWRRLFGNLTTT